MCQAADCVICGHAGGLVYLAWHHAGERSYAAAALCPACLHCEEI